MIDAIKPMKIIPKNPTAQTSRIKINTNAYPIKLIEVSTYEQKLEYGLTIEDIGKLL